MDNIKQICIELANLAKREHYFCEDSWYSCPKAEGGCANDAEGDECVCGADADNAKVNELLAAALARTEPEPTENNSAELAADIRRFLHGYQQMQGLDPENIYSIHRGDALESHLRVSQLARIAEILEAQ